MSLTAVLQLSDEMRMFAMYPEVLLTHGFCELSCKMPYYRSVKLRVNCSEFVCERRMGWRVGIKPAGAVRLTLYAVCTELLHLSPPPHRWAVTQHLLTARCQLASDRQSCSNLQSHP